MTACPLCGAPTSGEIWRDFKATQSFPSPYTIDLRDAREDEPRPVVERFVVKRVLSDEDMERINAWWRDAREDERS